jgi:hypothetical protein
MSKSWLPRILSGAPPTATDTETDVLRALRANRSSTVSLRDLRTSLADREPGIRDALWALETDGLVEVLESPTAGLICVLTEKGRLRVGHLDAPSAPGR